MQVHELLGLRVLHLGRDYAGREGWERDPVEHGGVPDPTGRGQGPGLLCLLSASSLQS